MGICVPIVCFACGVVEVTSATALVIEHFLALGITLFNAVWRCACLGVTECCF